MSPLSLSLSNPTAALVAGLLALLFGFLSLQNLPVQLTPDIERPEITIRTTWPGAAPQEIESEIIEPQEQQLRGLPGMTELLSEASLNNAKITISFAVDYDINRALIEVINRLNSVPSYPEDAEEPILSTAGGRSRPIAWFIIKTAEGNSTAIEEYRDFIEEVVQSRFERISGVALSEVRGGNELEVRVTVDLYKAAGLEVDLVNALNLIGTNDDLSAGTADVGKRRYLLRYIGALSPAQLNELVLEWRNGQPVYLRDIATVEVRPAERDSFVINRGGSAIAVNAYRESGVNVLAIMEDLKQAMAELRDGPIARANLTIEQVYDETEYIERSIDLLIGSLLAGILLAIAVLWWFLRNAVATLVVSITIPLCLSVAFIITLIGDSTINVITLAALAFAVGMVMDASIIVLENIVRHREQGESAREAALRGTREVWPALFASTATTVAIFLPVLYLRDQAGQLFADLALALTAAIIASLLVSTTLIPSAAYVWLRHTDFSDRLKGRWQQFANGVTELTNQKSRRWSSIVLLLIIPIGFSVFLFPDRDYLPSGNRNLVFGFVLPPPGVNIAHIENEMANQIIDRLQPYFEGEKSPKIAHYFFVASASGNIFIGGRAADPSKVAELETVINHAVSGFPDSIAFASRASLFSGIGANREIEVNFQGANIESLINSALVAYKKIPEVLPGARIRPQPGLELAEPELQFIPNDSRLAEGGWNRQSLGNISRILGQGLKVGEYFNGDEVLDIIVRSSDWETPEEAATLPLFTPDSGVLPFSELVSIERTAGPDRIRRIDRRRTITLEVTPPTDMALELALQKLKTGVLPVVEPTLSADSEIQFSGSIDSLTHTIKNLGQSFIIAIIILFLLMAALFQSFKDSLLVVLALPLATVGGVIGLQIIGKSADLMTMLGFIILLGLVVNNAILLVYKCRNAEREGTTRPEAIRMAIETRVRPILMSTSTSVLGMLPLVVLSGAGSELYNGLATVIVGGMLVSTIFTLLLIPCLLYGRADQSPAS